MHHLPATLPGSCNAGMKTEYVIKSNILVSFLLNVQQQKVQKSRKQLFSAIKI